MSPYFYFALPAYAVFAFVGGLFALLYTYFRIDKFNVMFIDMIKIFIVCAIGVFVGGKALFIVTQIPELIMNFSIINMINLVVNSGIVFYGGLFGVLFALKIYSKHSIYEESTVFQMMAPAIPLFHGFGRVGCLFAGCCYGKELEEPFTLFYTIHIDRVPTQAFEATVEFILFFVILIVGKKHKDWNLLKLYLISYALFRFVIEFFRGDEIRGIFAELSTSQWISITIIGYYIIKMIKKKPYDIHEESETVEA